MSIGDLTTRSRRGRCGRKKPRILRIGRSIEPSLENWQGDDYYNPGIRTQYTPLGKRKQRITHLPKQRAAYNSEMTAAKSDVIMGGNVIVVGSGRMNGLG